MVTTNISELANQVMKVLKLSVESIVEDIEKSIESTGVKVLYSDLNRANLSKEGRRIIRDYDGTTIFGYARVNRKGVPEIIINGNLNDYTSRRVAIMNLYSRVIFYWNWVVKEKVSRDLIEVLHDGKERDNRDEYAIELTAELLLPLQDVHDVIESYSFIKSERARRLIIKDSLISAYKVNNEIVRIQLNKVDKYLQ